MSRSAIIQARVRPEIKFAGERVLRGLGITMTDLMELVLRRLIVDQRLPFEAVALDDHQLTAIVAAWEDRGATPAIESGPSRPKKSRKREKRE
jgi:addiction module RelB/DinJ family antitoxin